MIQIPLRKRKKKKKRKRKWRQTHHIFFYFLFNFKFFKGILVLLENFNDICKWLHYKFLVVWKKLIQSFYLEDTAS
jgi:hypothetical protein